MSDYNRDNNRVVWFDIPVADLQRIPSEIVRHTQASAFIEIPENVLDIESVVDEVTSQLIRRAMDQTGDNTAQAARLLGIPRGTLRYKLKKYGLSGH